MKECFNLFLLLLCCVISRNLWTWITLSLHNDISPYCILQCTSQQSFLPTSFPHRSLPSVAHVVCRKWITILGSAKLASPGSNSVSVKSRMWWAFFFIKYAFWETLLSLLFLHLLLTQLLCISQPPLQLGGVTWLTLAIIMRVDVILGILSDSWMPSLCLAMTGGRQQKI